MSPNICPISFLPLARPDFGKDKCAESEKRSRMLPPSVVTPALSKALRYSTITDFLCSSVIVCLETAIDFSLRLQRRCAPRRQLLCAFLAFLVGRRRRQIRESQNRSDRGTACPIGPRRRRGDAIADPIEAGNG